MQGRAIPNNKHTLRNILILCLLILLIGCIGVGAYVWQPIMDARTLTEADPTMVALAHEAGMSRKGMLVFLRAKPQLVSDKQMESVCASNTAANNSNGFIEQGCYTAGSNRIYLRQMPSDLHDLTVATASYEMLHPVYIALHKSSVGKALDHAIEANYAAMNDPNLREQVTNFAKTEPGAKDLELFSLLGTGYTNLTPQLAQYYAPYFDNLSATINANKHIDQLFLDQQQKLNTLNGQINGLNAQASTDYATSVRWAHAGNQYEDDHYYNLYRQDVTDENALISQYNALLDSYNKLVTEFNGSQPVEQRSAAQ